MKIGRVSGLLFSLIIVTTPVIAESDRDRNGGHGGSEAAQSANTIRVDAEIAKRMGIQVESPTRQVLTFGIKTSGQIRTLPNQKVIIVAPILGTVVQLLVQPGDRVERGGVVALLSSPELAQLQVAAIQKRDEADAELQQAQADLRLAQQNYDRQQQQVRADSREAQARMALSQERYNRNRELAAAGAIARRQVQESEAELTAAQATLIKAQSRLGELEAVDRRSRAEAAVSVAQSHIRLSDAAYKARLRQLKTTANREGLVKVTTPISGVIVDRPVTPGETVTVEAASKPLMTVENNQRVWATANLYEKDLAPVKTGQQVRVKVTSLPNQTFTGRVVQIGAVVDRSSRVIPVNVELDNSRQLLKPEMFAGLEILNDRTPTAVLTIPSTAVVSENGQQLVFVQNGDAYHSIHVTLGRTSGNWVEIESGLNEGARIVTKGALLYTQSLGGGGVPSDGDDKGDKGEKNDIEDIVRKAQIPWWSPLPIAGLSAAVAFWTGRRSPFRNTPQSHSDAEAIAQEVERYLNVPNTASISSSAAKSQETEDRSQN